MSLFFWSSQWNVCILKTRSMYSIMLGSTILCSDNNKVEDTVSVPERGIMKWLKKKTFWSQIVIHWIPHWQFFELCDFKFIITLYLLTLISLFYIKNFKKVINKFQFKQKQLLWNINLSLLHMLPVFFLILKKKSIFLGWKKVSTVYI